MSFLTRFALLFCSVSTLAQTPPIPAISTDPLSAERLAIYRTFLAGYANGSNAMLNLSRTTTAFVPGEYDKSCLKSFAPAELAAHTLHTFAPDAFAGSPVRLVDPATHKPQDPDDSLLRGATVDQALADAYAAGLFTFSEIVFNSAHTHAAFSYSFVCGRLCGHGATVVYERHDAKWTRSDTSCGSWIS